jgi:predicted metalloprotease with PDZ domain
VNANSLIRAWPVWLASAAIAAALAGTPPTAGSPAAAPAAAPSARPDSSADLDAQLAAARKELEQAADEVARLSAELGTATIDRLRPLFGPGRAIIGVELDAGAGSAGARVREVSPGGPAAEAGIRRGDVIVAVNGTAVTGEQPERQVITIMRDVKPDSRVSLRVLREGKAREFVLTARPGPVLFATTHGLPDVAYGPWPELEGAFMLHRPFMDLELVTLTPRLGSYFGTDKGVLVVRAPADAAALKLEDGDVILAIDGRQPTSGSHATRILASYQPGEKVTLRILRQHRTQEIEATLPEPAGPARPERMRQDFPPAPPLPPPPPKLVIHGSDSI